MRSPLLLNAEVDGLTVMEKTAALNKLQSRAHIGIDRSSRWVRLAQATRYLVSEHLAAADVHAPDTVKKMKEH